MYLAIEGIKGSGKSLLIDSLAKVLKEEEIPFCIVAPTKKAHPADPMELLTRMMPPLNKVDRWNEYLYARRSAVASRTARMEDRIRLGDRSIVTSYATRWQKWGDPQICIDRVNRMEPYIPAPDAVLYLNVAPETAAARIAGRERRNYGLYDETLPRLREMDAHYREIQSYGIPRLNKTLWMDINAEQEAAAVVKDTLQAMIVMIRFHAKVTEQEFHENYIYN